jgi:hypothetical protein
VKAPEERTVPTAPLVLDYTSLGALSPAPAPGGVIPFVAPVVLDTVTLGTLAWGPTGGPPQPAPVCGADILQSGIAWLTGQLQAHASQPVVYSRGALRVALCATFGRTKLMLSNEFGATRIEWTDRDFIVPAAALVLGGVVVKPKRDDVITTDDGIERTTFSVLPYADEPHWKWCDPFRQMIRIHTQRISTEAR